MTKEQEYLRYGNPVTCRICWISVGKPVTWCKAAVGSCGSSPVGKLRSGVFFFCRVKSGKALTIARKKERLIAVIAGYPVNSLRKNSKFITCILT